MNRIKDILFPKIDPEVQSQIDVESINNTYRLSFAGMIFMLTAMAAFLFIVGINDPNIMLRIGKFISGFFICLGGFLFSFHLRKKEIPSHKTVNIFRIIYISVLAAWAIFVSYREYSQGEQLLIFFATSLLLICFVPLKPVFSIPFIFIMYAILYIMLYRIDGARGVPLRNYLILIFVSITGMIAVYHNLVRMSEKTIYLKKTNDLLAYTNRHDSLTGLYNRTALKEDLYKLIGKEVVLYMIDINYFKIINDTYGHIVGDEVLKETGKKLKEIFIDCLCYRYGGDEFLVVCPEKDPYEEDSYSFCFVPLKDDVVLSFGKTKDTIRSDEHFYQMIVEADKDLYETKKKTHY